MKVSTLLLTGSVAFALLATCCRPALAQDQAAPPPQKIETRFLFIFDTASSMEKRFEGEETQIDSLLAGRIGGHLQEGDSIGVWTFSERLHMGGLPLQAWTARNSSVIAGNIAAFVGTQKYGKSTDFKALQPYLNGLMLHSDRLIVMIFSDGDGEMIGTPYDKNITKSFEKNKAALKKAKQPFVLVLAAQQGKYVGANLGEPPGEVSVPDFPAWPEPPAPTNVPPVAPVVVQPPPPQVIPPLILIGKHSNSTPAPAPAVAPVAAPAVVPPPVVNPAPAPAPEPPPVTTAPPAVSATPAPATTATVQAPTTASATHPVEEVKNSVPTVATVTPPVTSPKTNSVAATTESADSNNKMLIGIGIGLLIAACILGVVLLARSRRNHSSLISDSMREK
jgi:hypothetical protein